MSDDESMGGDLFQEPEGYFKPEEEPTFVKHQMLNGNELQLRLVGHNPLWVGRHSTCSHVFPFFARVFSSDDNTSRDTCSGTLEELLQTTWKPTAIN